MNYQNLVSVLSAEAEGDEIFRTGHQLAAHTFVQ